MLHNQLQRKLFISAHIFFHLLLHLLCSFIVIFKCTNICRKISVFTIKQFIEWYKRNNTLLYLYPSYKHSHITYRINNFITTFVMQFHWVYLKPLQNRKCVASYHHSKSGIKSPILYRCNKSGIMCLNCRH